MSESILSFILNWVSTNTIYDGTLFKFQIILLSPEEIQFKACKGKCPILAFFEPQQGILITKLDFNNICNQSVLLHEIIHSFQYLSGSEIQDVFKEKEAYEIQNKFLMELSEKKGLVDLLNVKKCRSLQLNVLR